MMPSLLPHLIRSHGVLSMKVEVVSGVVRFSGYYMDPSSEAPWGRWEDRLDIEALGKLRYPDQALMANISEMMEKLAEHIEADSDDEETEKTKEPSDG